MMKTKSILPSYFLGPDVKTWSMDHNDKPPSWPSTHSASCYCFQLLRMKVTTSAKRVLGYRSHVNTVPPNCLLDYVL